MVLLISLLISTAQAKFDAKDVFRLNSTVPKELQVRIVQTIEAQCPTLVREASAIYEDSTREEKKYFDQSNADIFYHTNLVVQVPHAEHFVNYELYVRSLEGSWNNPAVDKFSVEAVIGCP